MASYVDRLAPGSYVGITHARLPEPDDPRYESFAQVTARYHEVSPTYTPRTPAGIHALFAGLELVEPGIVPLDEWWPEGPSTGERCEFAEFAVGGVARKR